MSNKLVNALMFAAGAAIGSVVTWKLLQTKYERFAQEQIDSVKETYAGLSDNDESDDEVSDSDDSEEDCSDEDCTENDEQDSMMDRFEYEAEIRRLSYRSAEDAQEGGGEAEEHVDYAPYVIDPNDAGDNGYELSSLTYYSDGVLEDDYWNVLENPDEIVGDSFMNHFGEYAGADETVFIRNEALKTDYEITRDRRTYAESQNESPRMVMQDD